MKIFEIVARFWFYGESSPRQIVRTYTVETKEEAKKLFDDHYCSILGTGHIISIEEVEEGTQQ